MRKILSAAFNFTSMDNIDVVYPKEALKDEQDLIIRTENWFKTKVRDCKKDGTNEHLIEMLFENANKAMQIKEKEEKEDAEDTDDSDSDNGVEEEKGYQNCKKSFCTAISHF